ncbi:hypothetical protein RHO13_01910 [Orbus wheelerorum]|uniref:hypothetical protein n=1 Tax=Orbus wheelerorum TaxID=3074111 RepID=UPI00370D9557
MKNNKLSNKIAIIVCVPFLIIGGAYFIYHECVLKGKDISEIISENILLIFMFSVACGIHFLLEKGFSIISIKILILFIGAVVFFIGNLFNW